MRVIISDADEYTVVIETGKMYAGVSLTDETGDELTTEAEEILIL